MANYLSFVSARVLHTGRHIEVKFTANQPIDFGAVDWLQGYQLGKTITLSVNSTPISSLEFLGCTPYSTLSFTGATVVSYDPISGVDEGLLTISKTNAFTSVYTFGQTLTEGPTAACLVTAGSNMPANSTNGYKYYALMEKINNSTITLRTANKMIEDDMAPAIGSTDFGGDLLYLWNGNTLFWKAIFKITNSSEMITFGQSGITISGDAGLLRDIFDNQSNSFSNQSVTNLSVMDSDGFTTDSFTRGNGGVVIYINPSHPSASDSYSLAQAQNMSTPLRSLSAATEKTKSGSYNNTGTTFKIQQGTTQNVDDYGNDGVYIYTSGYSLSSPIIIESYWDSTPGAGGTQGVRPIINAHGYGTCVKITGNWSNNHSNIVLRGLKLVSQPDGGHPFANQSPGNNIILDDCELVSGGNVLELQAYMKDVTINRCIIVDGWGVGGHIQGIYAAGMDNLLIFQTIVENCGRRGLTGLYGDIYSHNCYIQTGMGPATFDECILSRGGATGVQLRSGGVITNCLFSKNGLDAFVSMNGGRIGNCYVEKTTDIPLEDGISIERRGYGLYPTGSVQGAILELNVTANVNSIGNVNTENYGFSVDASTGHMDVGSRNVIIRNNTSYKHGSNGLIYDNNGFPRPNNVVFWQNLFDNSVSSGVAFFMGSNFDYAMFSETVNYDALVTLTATSTSSGTAARIAGSSLTLAGLRSAVGIESGGTILVSPSYVAPSADLGTYYNSIGGTSSDVDYMNHWRNRGLGTWNSTYNVKGAVDYMKGRYALTVPSTVGVSPLNFHGAGTGSYAIYLTGGGGGNQAPTAVAGGPYSATDSGRTGYASITLNGSGSSDPDGTISTYTWDNNGTWIASGSSSSTNYNFPVGIYSNVGLTVTDNLGLESDRTSTSVTVTAVAPNNLQANAIVGNVIFSCDAYPTASSYQLIYSTNSNNLSSSATSSSPSFTVSGTAGVNIYGKIAAIINGVTSPYQSQPVYAAPLAVLQPPSAPTNLVLTDNLNGTCTVAWADTSNNETSFEIERTKNSQVTTITASADATSTIDSCGSGTIYYRVRAVNAAGSSSWLGPQSIVIAGSSNNLPVAVISGTYSITDTSRAGGTLVEMDASDSFDPDIGDTISEYLWDDQGIIKYDGADPKIYLSFTLGVHKDIGLTVYSVTNSVSYPSERVKTDVTITPNYPAGVSATAVTNGVRFSCSLYPQSSKYALTYHLAHSTISNDPNPTILSSSSNTFTVSGSPGTRIYGRMSVSAASTSSPAIVVTSVYSSQVSAVIPVPPSPPNAPTGLVLSNNQNGTCTLSWTDNSSDESYFELERSPAFSGPVQTTNNSLTDSCGAGTFQYRVRAVNANGASSWLGWQTVIVTSIPSGGGQDPFRLDISSGGITIVNGSNYDLGTVDKGELLAKTFILKNGGVLKSVVINDISVSGDVEIRYFPDMPLVLLPNNTNWATFSILFSSLRAGDKNGSIIIDWVEGY